MLEGNITMVDKNICVDEAFMNKREPSGLWGVLVIVIALTLSLFQMYTAVFGVFVALLQRSAHLGLALLLVFMTYGRTAKCRKVEIFDALAIMLTMLVFGYVIFNYFRLANRYIFIDKLTAFEVVMGFLALALVLEACRRVVGWSLVIVCLVFLLYAFLGHLLPGVLYHPRISVVWIIEQLFYTTEGLFAIPTGVSATFAAAFVIFGTFLQKSGAGKFFIDLSIATMGSYRGGPAKTAILASGFLGMLNGSSTSNVLTTGAFTIPMMKKIGYQPYFAGAVEAAASTGGMLMPPIMGATAFILAEFTGIPYHQVAIAALIPAILYFMSIGIQVHLRAVKTGLQGLPKSEIPDVWQVLRSGFQFFLPLVMITVILLRGYSPLRSALWGILATVAASYVNRDTRMSLADIYQTLVLSGKNILVIAVSCASAGIIVGVATQTGIGLQLTSLVVRLSQDILLLGLILTMLTSIILGMGLPTSAAYIIQAALIVPALIRIGIPTLSAHMFVFYFACLSFVTPPVALAAITAAGVAGANPMKTGFAAWKLCLAAFIIPFMFVYGPSMLMQGSVPEIIWTFITALLGITGLAAAVEGWLFRHTRLLERLMLFSSAFVLILPGFLSDAIGFGLFMLVVVMQKASLPRTVKLQ
jgi:TRAP transporter 4TM/12TM fusion protein